MNTSILANETRIVTKQANPKVTDWAAGSRDNCQWGVPGKIIKHSDSHGLCYQVEHSSGSTAWYDASEIEEAP